jgi:hypothetical protein
MMSKDYTMYHKPAQKKPGFYPVVFRLYRRLTLLKEYAFDFPMLSTTLPLNFNL